MSPWQEYRWLRLQQISIIRSALIAARRAYLQWQARKIRDRRLLIKRTGLE